MDVIRFVILPYVANDYFARVAINSMVAWDEKIASPLKKNAAIQLEISLITPKLKRLLEGCEFDPYLHIMAKDEEKKARAEQKALKICEIFDINIKNPILLKHNLNYRQTVERKAREFADPDCSQYSIVCDETKVLVLAKAIQLLEAVVSNPFRFAESGSGQENWSPIDGAPARVIVDNSALLAVARARERAAAEAAEKERRSKPHWRSICYYRRGRYSGDSDDDSYGDEEWQYGYYEDGNYPWICLKTEIRNEWGGSEEDEQYEEWRQQQQEEWERQEQPKVSRRGTVMEADGWERVVPRGQRY